MSKDIKTKEIMFEFDCEKCGYNNRVIYNWPEKVYNQSNYEFEIFCTECGKEYKHDHKKYNEQIEDKTQGENKDETTIESNE